MNEEMNAIFQKERINIIDGGMVSISKVSVTPDLLEARIYLSFFQIKDKEQLLKDIIARTGEWRKLLGMRVKNQVRRVPFLTFFEDDTLDHVFKMEAIFQQIKEERDARNTTSQSGE